MQEGVGNRSLAVVAGQCGFGMLRRVESNVDLVKITVADLAEFVQCLDIQYEVAQSTNLDLIYSLLVITQLKLVRADHGV